MTSHSELEAEGCDYPLCATCGVGCGEAEHLVRDGRCFCSSRCLAAWQEDIEAYLEASRLSRYPWEAHARHIPGEQPWVHWHDYLEDPWYRDAWHAMHKGRP